MRAFYLVVISLIAVWDITMLAFLGQNVILYIATLLCFLAAIIQAYLLGNEHRRKN